MLETQLQPTFGKGVNMFQNIHLYDVILVIEGDTCFHKCGFGLKQCNNDNPCPLHEKYKVVRDGFFEIVKTETIQSLSEKIKQGNAVLNRIVNKD